MSEKSEELLAAFFARNGCVRRPNQRKRRRLGRRYKKGYEVRFLANAEKEHRLLKRLLRELGFKPGKAYVKRTQIVLPVYGKAAVERLQKLLKAEG